MVYVYTRVLSPGGLNLPHLHPLIMSPSHVVSPPSIFTFRHRDVVGQGTISPATEQEINLLETFAVGFRENQEDRRKSY